MTDLYGEGAPDSVRIYPDGHPDKRADMMVDGRFQSVTKGRKALEVGDCRTTDGASDLAVAVLEDCTEMLPLPNGGCRKVRVPGLSPSEWYIFGDALASNAAEDSVSVVTPNDRARLCPRSNCRTGEHRTRIPTGAKLPILDSRQVQSGMQTIRWYLVSYRGGQGWVSEHDVQRVE